MLEQIIDAEDCVLVGNSTWITVNNFSIRLAKKNNGIEVKVFNVGEEDSDPIDEIRVYDSSADEKKGV